MSSTSYTFRYRDGRFELIGYDDNSTERNSGKTEGISINYLTGRAKHTSGTIDSDSVEVSWEALPRRPLHDARGGGRRAGVRPGALRRLAGMRTEFTVSPRRRREGDRDAGPRTAGGGSARRRR